MFKILIVDDVPKNIQVAASILAKEGYQIGFAQSGETALSQVKTNHFDLILLDIMMPEMDGFTVCTHLKKDDKTKDIPIIFLTAKTETESVVKGFELGAVDYVTKPFNHTELIARVNTHIELQDSKNKLSQSEKELRESNATKDKFFSIISHDLRSPFNSLLGCTSLLIKDYNEMTSEDILGFIQDINQSSVSVMRLLENLLEWSRSQTGSITYDPIELELNDLIRIVNQLLSEVAKNKEIKIHVDVSNDLVIYADYYMIDLVIRNLISNALKFTHRKGDIHILARNLSHNFIEIVVKDNGLGIPEADQYKLFDVGTHYSRNGTEAEKGTGLGLVLCKEFIKKNKGTIRIESKEGVGSSFFITLPSKKQK